MVKNQSLNYKKLIRLTHNDIIPIFCIINIIIKLLTGHVHLNYINIKFRKSVKKKS